MADENKKTPGPRAGLGALGAAKKKKKKKLLNANEFFELVDSKKEFTGPKSTKGSLGDSVNRFRKMDDDLIIKIKEIPNDRFIHKNRDIYIEEDIQLWDSILGCDHIVKYIDSDIILNIDKIIDPNMTMIVKDYGMPKFGNHACGNLIIKFNIIYPDSIPNKESIQSLVDHPNYDYQGISTDYYNRINMTNDNNDDDYTQPQCVQQ